MRTEQLLVLGLEARDARLELVTTALVHLILLLHLPETVDRLADECLRVCNAAAKRNNVVV